MGGVMISLPALPATSSRGEAPPGTVGPNVWKHMQI